MTESLRTLLHDRATSVDFRPSDVDAIARAGGRRLRRRRVVTVLATAGVVATIALAGAAVAASSRPAPGPASPSPSLMPSPSPSPSLSSSAVWAVDTTIHDGALVVDVGHPVRAFVRTSVGYVVADDGVYAVVGDDIAPLGRLHDVPEGPEHPLVANTAGTLVVWVDGSAPDADAVLRVYSTTSGGIWDIPDPGGAGAFRPYAVDDRTAYVRAPTGIYAVDLERRTSRMVVEGPAIGLELYDVQGGLLVFERDGTIYIGATIDGAHGVYDLPRDTGVSGLRPRLSPGGEWLAFTVNNPSGFAAVVVETATGQTVGLDVPAASVGAFFRVWLGEGMVQATSFYLEAGEIVMGIYRCRLPSGACETAAEVDGFDAGLIVSFPDGAWYQTTAVTA